MNSATKYYLSMLIAGLSICVPLGLVFSQTAVGDALTEWELRDLKPVDPGAPRSDDQTRKSSQVNSQNRILDRSRITESSGMELVAMELENHENSSPEPFDSPSTDK